MLLNPAADTFNVFSPPTFFETLDDFLKLEDVIDFPVLCDNFEGKTLSFSGLPIRQSSMRWYLDLSPLLVLSLRWRSFGDVSLLPLSLFASDREEEIAPPW
jgi:hypothetical protein